VVDDPPGPEPVEEPAADEHHPEGLDLARTLARAMAGSTAPYRPRTRSTGRRRPPRVEPGLSGAHPDARDPQTLDASLASFVRDQGWGTELRVHGVFSRWEAIVGADIARHATPESFADGRLSVRAGSTAWATQLRLLAPDLVRRLNEVLGDGTVERIEVRGPQAPSWVRGTFRVRGRGPRDTYG
jgi:predicted nucleic acid-binding Zn ribbon protein